MSIWNKLTEDIITDTEFSPIIENTESPYQTDAKPISDELAFQVCELLGLDPDNVNTITIEAGTLKGGIQLIIRSIKR